VTLFDEPETEAEEPEEQGAGKYIGHIIFLITLPVLLYFTHIGNTELGLKVGICLGMNIFAVVVRWDLRRHWWFWAVIVLVLALNVPLVLNIPWPERRVPPLALLPIGLADMLLAIGAVRFVEKYIVKAPPANEGDD
jgi:hypothetical protein